MTFDRAYGLTFSKSIEGGYSNQHADRGGLTYGGIPQKTYDRWRDANELEQQSVTLMTEIERRTLTKTWFWIPTHCDDLHERTGCMHFDAAINHGQPNAMRLLQEAVGADVDGSWGPRTKAKCDASDDLATLNAYAAARSVFFDEIEANDHTQTVFDKGWHNRLKILLAALQ